MTEALHARTIPELMDDAARRFAGHEAIVDGDTRLTYSELADAVGRCARAFVAAGLEKGDPIALWAPNSAAWVVAALGAQRAGGVIVPINTRYRGEEAAYVLDRCGARALVVQHGFLGTDYLAMLADAGADLPALAVTVVLGDGATAPALDWSAFLTGGDGAHADALEAEVRARVADVTPEDLSDIMFTSGTTGYAKGVTLTHGQSLRVFQDWCDIVGLAEGDRTLIVNPFFHTFGYKAGVLAALMRGATMVPLDVFNVSSIVTLIARERITVLPGPPALFQDLLNHTASPDTDLSSLRLAITGGAAVPAEMIRAMKDTLGFQDVLTGYGLTETNGTATMCRIGDDIETVASSCGRAIPDTEIRVVDDAGTPAPTATPGEIQIRGYHVTHGYLDDPDATAQAIDSDGWFRTGDVGTLDERGYLRITDRIKEMFIVGGFNAYPAEIERVIHGHPAVAQVAAIGVPDARLGEVGVVFVVAKRGTSLDPDELISWCRPRLANFKIPRQVHVLPALPLGATGKVDKAALRDTLTPARPSDPHRDEQT